MWAAFASRLQSAKGLVSITVCILLSHLNATKSLESMGDYLAYHDIFVDFSTRSVSDALVLMGKDYFFYVVFWTMSRLMSFKVAIFVITFISFHLLYKSFFALSKSLSGFLLFTAFIVSWPIFGLSAHIIRQFVAMSFFFYGLVDLNRRRKRGAIFVLLSAGIHTSILVFLVLLIVANLKLVIHFFMRNKLVFMPVALLLLSQSRVLLGRFIEGSIDDGSLLRNDTLYTLYFACLISVCFVLIKNDLFNRMFLYTTFMCLFLISYVNPFLFGRYQFYVYLYLTLGLSKTVKKYSLISFLVLVSSVYISFSKLNNSGYTYDFGIENLFLFWL